MFKDLAIVLPARINSSRLKQKPMQVISGKTILQLSCEKAVKTKIDTYIASDFPLPKEFKDVNVILTDPELPSGSDRVFAALRKINKDYKYVINLQCDMPFIDPKDILKLATRLIMSEADIVTLAAESREEYASSNSAVKIVKNIHNNAIYFSRSMVPYNTESYLLHIGIYGFKYESLKKFVSLPTSYLEKLESLEQLRAIENGMTIEVVETDNIPISIDTKEDLDKARKICA